MKTKYLLFALSLFAIACSDNNKRSDAYGNFEAKEIIVSAEAQGKILDLKIEEGQALSANEIIGLIDTVQLSLKKEQLIAQKNVISTKISSILSQIDIQEEQKKTLLIEKERIEKLLKDNAATTQQLDNINGKLNVLESQIKSIRTQNSTVLNELEVLSKQVDQLEDQLKKCTLVNPIKGTVLEKYVEPYEIAVMGRSLYKIADLSEMELRIYISGEQLPHIKIGQAVQVMVDEDDKKNKNLEGTISWISQQAEFTPKIIQTKEERVNLVYAVKVRVKNDGTLKIGMPGEVLFSSK